MANKILNKTFIVLLAVLCILLAGCTGGSRENSNWKTGTQGVVVQFGQNSPPAEMYEDEDYSLVLEVRNKGSYPTDQEDSLPVDLYFSGFEPNVVDLGDRASVDVEGSKSQFNPDGGVAYHEEEFGVDELGEEIDSLPQDIRVTYVYEYETFAPLDVCVDPNPTRNDDDTCTPGAVGGTGGQAAPVGVASVQQESLKNKVRFTMRISNLGGGDILRDDRYVFNVPENEKNVVEVDEVLLGGEDMDCTPERDLRLNGGAGVLSCTYDGLDEELPAYKTTLSVRLHYWYKDSVSKSTVIKHNLD